MKECKRGSLIEKEGAAMNIRVRRVEIEELRGVCYSDCGVVEL